MKGIIIFSLLMTLPFSAQAGMVTCADVFRFTVQDWLQSWDLQHNMVLFGGSIDEYVNSQGRWRQRRVRKLLNSFHPEMFSDRVRVDIYANDLIVALYGTRDIIDRYFLKDGDQRLKDSAAIRMKHQLISMGLNKLIENTPLEQRQPLRQKFKAAYYRWTQSQLYNFIGLASIPQIGIPASLPQIKDRTLSPVLLEKMIWEGVDSQVENLRVEYRLQSTIEAYNVIRRIYQMTFIVAAVGIGFYLGYNQQEEEKKKDVREALDRLADLEKAAGTLSREAFRQEAYRKSIESFLQKWGEPPTPEEDRQIRNLIWDGRI